MYFHGATVTVLGEGGLQAAYLVWAEGARDPSGARTRACNAWEPTSPS